MILPFRKTRFNDFHCIFRYLFWQCFLKCLGIDFVFLFDTLSASMFVFGALYNVFHCKRIISLGKGKGQGLEWWRELLLAVLRFTLYLAPGEHCPPLLPSRNLLYHRHLSSDSCAVRGLARFGLLTRA